MAARLYQHDHGKWPDSAWDLYPKYLSWKPVDIGDDQGACYRYDTEDKRFQSAGRYYKNGLCDRDDGG